MKITRSRDGVPRTTLRLDFRMGRTDLANALALAVAKGSIEDIDSVFDADDLDNLPERMGRQRILDAAKDVIHQYGYDALSWWRDDFACDDEVEEWAQSVVDAAFPEFQRGLP